MSESNISLKQMPSLLSLVPELARSSVPFFKKSNQSEAVTLSVKSVKANAKSLALYRTVTGHTGKDGCLPLLFPFCMNTPAMMKLGCDPRVGIPLLGAVHVRIKARQLKPMPEGASYRFENRVVASRVVKKGMEYDVQSEMFLGDECYWQATNTLLCPGKFKGEAVEPDSLESLPIEYPKVGQFVVGTNMARRYARASGDWNPIHQLSLLAKLSGFKKTVIHGMWMLAKSLSFFEMEDDATITCQFKGPVYLGDQCQLQADFQQEANRVDVVANRNTRPNLCLEFEGMGLKDQDET